MKIQDTLSRKSILIDIKAQEKTDLLTTMARFLSSIHDLKNPDHIVHKILEREADVSTGIGLGIAIPHARTDMVEGICMVAARVAGEVDFDSIDEQPVRLVFMMVSPSSRSTGHSRTLSGLSRIMSHESVREELTSVPDAESFLRVLTEGENKYGGE